MKKNKTERGERVSVPFRGREVELTVRMHETYNLLLTGITNRQIAAKMFVAVKCIKFHLTNIYKAFGVKSRAELIAKSLRSDV